MFCVLWAVMRKCGLKNSPLDVALWSGGLQLGRKWSVCWRLNVSAPSHMSFQRSSRAQALRIKLEMEVGSAKQAK